MRQAFPAHAMRVAMTTPAKPALHERLDGQVALVTGATRGIGATVAARLFDLGATVYAGARNPRDIAGAREDSDGRVRPVRLDVLEEDDIAAAVRQAVRDTGRLDILVNNAGVYDRRSELATLDAARLDAVLATNLRGPMLAAKHAVPQLLARPGGRIVNVSSGMGAIGDGLGATAPAYRVSKAGVNALTAYLHAEYGHRGLLANAVCPGWVRTDMGGEHAPRSVEQGADTIVWLARFRPGSPAGLFWRDRAAIPW
jgi:NAD(P)-dependent dehydrogenase (short-subunit alcohol dehydrogenase family)